MRFVLRDAEVAVHNGDAGPRRAIWSRNDPGDRVGCLEECRWPAEALGDTAYTVGLEHTSASVDGVPQTYTLRATQTYRREDGTWKVAHRHGSAPPE